MKPLYLKNVMGMSVDYEEPALKVNVPNKARQLFPLPRISRVVVTGPVVWSTPALLACADAGVPVVFLRDTGEVRGQWLGNSRYRCDLVQLFSDALLHADTVDRYQDWLAGTQRMAVRSAARRLGFADWQEADAAALTAWFDREQKASWRCVNESILGLLLSSVLPELGRLGLDARSLCWQDRRFGLSDDFCRLLFWDFYPALIRWQAKSLSVPEHQSVVAFYEQRLVRTEQLLRGLINRWHQWLLAWVDCFGKR